MKTRIISEIGSNWRLLESLDKSHERALQLILESKNSGATAVKFQLFRADRLYHDKKQINTLKPYELPNEWLLEFKNYAESLGLQFLCTPFYLEAVDTLEELDITEYKAASWDITYLPLLERIGQTGKPVLLSTAASLFEEVEAAINALRPEEERPKDVILLHCNSGYPTPIEETRLKKILDLGTQFFPMTVGFSSHVVNPAIVASSILFQSKVIEVHFDLEDKRGVESGHSYTPRLMEQLVSYVRDFELALDCGCSALTNIDIFARNSYRRKSENWLR